MESIPLQPTRDLVGLDVHNNVMHEGLMLLQHSTPEALHSSLVALKKSTQVEKNAFSSPFLMQAMMLCGLVAQVREVLHVRGRDKAPENQPQVKLFSKAVMITASLLLLPKSPGTPKMVGGGVVAGKAGDAEPKAGLWAEDGWSFVVMGGGAILNFSVQQVSRYCEDVLR